MGIKKFFSKVADVATKPMKKAVKMADKVAVKAGKLDPTKAAVNKLAGKKLAGKLDMARTVMSRGPGFMRVNQVTEMLGKRAGKRNKK